jgi:hypothetical protein
MTEVLLAWGSALWLGILTFNQPVPAGDEYRCGDIYFKKDNAPIDGFYFGLCVYFGAHSGLRGAGLADYSFSA